MKPRKHTAAVDVPLVVKAPAYVKMPVVKAPVVKAPIVVEPVSKVSDRVAVEVARVCAICGVTAQQLLDFVRDEHSGTPESRRAIASFRAGYTTEPSSFLLRRA